MYTQDEHKYLQYLNCVNIVKSIRELKALARVVLSQHQRQLLAFERESVLSSSRSTDRSTKELTHGSVPFEHANPKEQTEYSEKVDRLVGSFADRELSGLDVNIIDEICYEKSNLIDESIKNNLVHPKFNKLSLKN